MIDGLSEKRIPVYASLGIVGEGLAAAAGILLLVQAGKFDMAGFSLALGGTLGLYAYCVLLLMGKAWARRQAKTPDAKVKMTSIQSLMRPFMMWRYPVDSACMLLTFAGFCYYLAGLVMANPALILLSCLVMTASCLAWFWPKNKPLSGYSIAQVTTLIFLVASLAYLGAGFIGNLYALIGAGIFNFAAYLVLLAPSKAVPQVAPAADSEDDKEDSKSSSDDDKEPSAPSGKSTGKRRR